MLIQHIDYQYPDSRFSINISEIKIEAGKAYLLLGLNGSGKTTLLSILSGFLPCKKMVVPNGFYTYLHSYNWAGKIKLTVRDFFQQTFLIINKSTGDLDKALEAMGLSEIKTQRLTSLSSGQLQRCLTEVAFLQEAPLLLFDEPLNALDFLNRELFIAKTKQSLIDGKYIIASSHIDSILEIDFEGVLILHNGKLVSTESTDSVRKQNLTYKEFYEKTIRNIY
jgi:ABC-type multidrug transport system ATPase subunit